MIVKGKEVKDIEVEMKSTDAILAIAKEYDRKIPGVTEYVAPETCYSYSVIRSDLHGSFFLELCKDKSYHGSPNNVEKTKLTEEEHRAILALRTLYEIEKNNH